MGDVDIAGIMSLLSIGCHYVRMRHDNSIPIDDHHCSWTYSSEPDRRITSNSFELYVVLPSIHSSIHSSFLVITNPPSQLLHSSPTVSACRYSSGSYLTSHFPLSSKLIVFCLQPVFRVAFSTITTCHFRIRPDTKLARTMAPTRRNNRNRNRRSKRQETTAGPSNEQTTLFTLPSSHTFSPNIPMQPSKSAAFNTFGSPSQLKPLINIPHPIFEQKHSRAQWRTLQ